jgi:hypothetical protein
MPVGKCMRHRAVPGTLVAVAAGLPTGFLADVQSPSAQSKRDAAPRGGGTAILAILCDDRFMSAFAHRADPEVREFGGSR